MRKLMGVLLAVAMLITASTSLAEMTPGTYTAEATGNNGPVSVAVTVDEQDFPDVEEVDVKLLKLAKLRDGCVLTTDYNLNKVAGVSGIQVLNINDLANALKPVALPGEEMEVLIVKEGKEQNQGVGYLDDGTMIVVEGGKQAIGQTVTVSVTSVLQTSAGRMIFAKMQE